MYATLSPPLHHISIKCQVVGGCTFGLRDSRDRGQHGGASICIVLVYDIPICMKWMWKIRRHGQVITINVQRFFLGQREGAGNGFWRTAGHVVEVGGWYPVACLVFGRAAGGTLFIYFRLIKQIQFAESYCRDSTVGLIGSPCVLRDFYIRGLDAVAKIGLLLFCLVKAVLGDFIS